MQPTPDIRRHSDRSIDFDFYRRRAMRRRRLVRRMFVKHYLTMVGQTVSASASAVASPTIILSPRRSKLRLLTRVAAGTAVLIAAAAFQVWAQADHSRNVSTSEETVIQLHSVGPWGITYANPADDPRQK